VSITDPKPLKVKNMSKTQPRVFHGTLKRKRHQKSSTSHKSSSTSNFQDFTPESKPRKNSGKPGPTLAVNSILQELLGSSAGPSSTAYKRANNEANQGLRSSSRSHVVKAAKVSAFAFEKTVNLTNFTILTFVTRQRQLVFRLSTHSF
jgi:hypothetical protein